MNSHFRLAGRLLTKVTSGAIFMLLLNPVGVQAQTSVTVPDSSTSTGNFTLFNSGMRNLQLIIDDTMLTSIAGKQIKSIAFRLPNTATTAWPTSAASVSSFDIYMGKGVEPANRQLNFDANIVGSKTLVRSGVLNIPAGSFPLNTATNPYSFELVFDTPWFYAGDNLVIEIRHPGITGGSSAMAGVATSTTGYGTLYTACWTSTAAGTPAQASFNSVKINAVDNLGVSSVEFSDEVMVYPNPAEDYIYIKTNKNIKQLIVLNSEGRNIYTQDSKDKISIGSFVPGVYYLQIVDREGNVTSSKFIKK